MIYLSKIHLDHVGPFAQQDLQFTAGLNVVCGPNEAGKSTVARAMLATIVGEPDSERLRQRPYEGQFGAAVRLETDGGGWTIDRDFGDHTVRVSQIVEEGRALERFRAPAPPRGRGQHAQAYRQLVCSLFGLPDLQLLPPLLGGALERGWSGENAAQVRQALSGQLLLDHQKVQKALLDKHFALTKVNPAGRNRPKPGRLEQLDDEIQTCREALNRARDSADALGKAEARFALAEQRLAALDREIKALGEKIERLAAWQTLQDNLAKADEALANLAADRGRLTALQAAVADLQRRRQEQAAIDSLDEERLAALRRRRGLLATAAEREAKRQATQDERPVPRSPWRWGAPLLLAILALGAAGVALLPAWRMSAAIAAAAAGAISAGVVLRAWLAANTARTVREARLADLAADRDQALAAAATIEIGGGFDRLDWVELEDVLRRAEALADIRRQLDKTRAQLGMLPPAEELERAAAQTRAHLEQWRVQAEALREALGELDPAQPRLLEALPARLESLESGRERAARERDDALALAGQSRARLDNPASWEERLADLEAERAHVAVESAALWTAVATLDEALAEFMGEDLTRLAAGAQRFFDELTTGPARRVEVDASLTPSLARGGEVFAFDLLSQATGEQLLLCCRLALLDHLTGERGAPLWLDDAAVGYDAARADRLMTLLQRIAADRQVIIFTPDERLAATAGPTAHVVRLSPPGAS